MNSVERFITRVIDHPDRCAIWMPDGRRMTFHELAMRASWIQHQLLRLKLSPGDPVLMLLGLGFDLYATVIALLSSGFPVVLVEPWMPLSKIEAAVSLVRPRAFLSSWLGRAWGLRSSAIRAIPHWLTPESGMGREIPRLVSVPPEHPGILTFTSGTTGTPKGVVRHHGYLWNQHNVLESHLHPSADSSRNSPDWCIFANFTLANLGSGRTTLLMPPSWSARDFSIFSRVSGDLAPRSLTCGPAFLSRMLSSGLSFDSLKSIHVGGALTDCALFEDAFRRFPDAEFHHVYGSTEAEPVATINARVAVSESRSAGFLQTLCLGVPVPEIQTNIEDSRLWVSGPHVCPRYLGNEGENQIHKRTDAAGVNWHNMGDRVRRDSKNRLWYAGRTGQLLEDFRLEQDIYSVLGHTSAFLERDVKGQLWLLGEHVVQAEPSLRRHYPELRYIEDLNIIRDHRHRARIDRPRTLRKGTPWLVG